MRTFGGGGGAAPKQKAKPKPKAKGKSSSNQLGAALADMLKNVGTTVQRASNEATARKMPAIAKQRGFHVVGNQAYFSNATGQVEPVFGSKLRDLLAASKPTGGRYGAKIFAGNVRVRGAQKLGSLQDTLDRMNAINDAYRARQESFLRSPDGRNLILSLSELRKFNPALGDAVLKQKLDLNVPKPSSVEYSSGLPDFLTKQKAVNEKPNKSASWWKHLPVGIKSGIYYTGGY